MKNKLIDEIQLWFFLLRSEKGNTGLIYLILAISNYWKANRLVRVLYCCVIALNNASLKYMRSKKIVQNFV